MEETDCIFILQLAWNIAREDSCEQLTPHPPSFPTITIRHTNKFFLNADDVLSNLEKLFVRGNSPFTWQMMRKSNDNTERFMAKIIQANKNNENNLCGPEKNFLFFFFSFFWNYWKYGLDFQVFYGRRPLRNTLKKTLRSFMTPSGFLWKIPHSSYVKKETSHVFYERRPFAYSVIEYLRVFYEKKHSSFLWRSPLCERKSFIKKKTPLVFKKIKLPGIQWIFCE